MLYAATVLGVKGRGRGIAMLLDVVYHFGLEYKERSGIIMNTKRSLHLRPDW